MMATVLEKPENRFPKITEEGLDDLRKRIGVKIENTMLKHADVQECAVIGAPDATRGLVVKAFVVSSRAPSDAFVTELQIFTRERLAQHEFPRLVAFVDELPKTPAGKVHRKILRDREAAAALALTN